MPEISQGQYDLLMDAIRANGTATASLTETLTALRERYAERFLTREEDDRHDAQLVKGLQGEIETSHAALKDKIDEVRRLVYWLAGAAILLATASIGVHAAGH